MCVIAPGNPKQGLEITEKWKTMENEECDHDFHCLSSPTSIYEPFNLEVPYIGIVTLDYGPMSVVSPRFHRRPRGSVPSLPFAKLHSRLRQATSKPLESSTRHHWGWSSFGCDAVAAAVVTSGGARIANRKPETFVKEDFVADGTTINR